MVDFDLIENKDYLYIASLVLLAMISIGSIAYNVYDTGEEITCRTGDGWTIIEEYDGYYKAQCQYKSKDFVDAYCSSFRSTASYARYGCHEVVLVQVDNTVINPSGSGSSLSSGSKWSCGPKGVPCVQIE